MNKKIKLMLAIIMVVLVMVSCKKADPITLPNADDSQVITVTKIEEKKEGQAVSITSKKDILDMINLIKEKSKPTRKQSNNDTPANTNDFRKMEIFYGKDEKATLYLYQNKNYYIEKPYEGVWEIDKDTFDKLIGAM